MQRRGVVRIAGVYAEVNADRVAGNAGVADRFETFDALSRGRQLPGLGVTGAGGGGVWPVRG